MIHNHCLVLNADYSPMGIIHWQKAMIWSFRYTQTEFSGIEIIEYHNDDYIVGTKGLLKIPSVVKTTRYFKLFGQSVNFSRKNVFIRDDFICQYCHKKFPINKLTYDHVIPKSKWNKKESPTSWINIVTACVLCNSKKGNKTLAQANMFLKKTPSIPQKSLKYLPLVYQLHTIEGSIPEQWKTYIGDIINAKL